MLVPTFLQVFGLELSSQGRLRLGKPFYLETAVGHCRPELR